MVIMKTLKPLLTWAELHPSSTQISMVPKAFSFCHQVWSPTQFYSVDFSQSRIDVKKCAVNKRTIKYQGSCQMFMTMSLDLPS